MSPVLHCRKPQHLEAPQSWEECQTVGVPALPTLPHPTSAWSVYIPWATNEGLAFFYEMQTSQER